MTISFSYAYLKGLLLLIVSSDWVVTAVHLAKRAISPLMTRRKSVTGIFFICRYVLLTVHQDSFSNVIRIVSGYDMVYS